MDGFRLETDALGPILVPADAHFGAQTQRAAENFDVSGSSLGDFPEYLRAIVAVKKAAALANRDVGTLPDAITEAICAAADELLLGSYRRADFPVDMFNAGGGVSVNMNVNEVLAARASKMLSGQPSPVAVHPNDHVNASQSTSDVLATAVNVTLHRGVVELLSVVRELRHTLTKKLDEYSEVVKLSRTCLQDAVPIKFTQEFGSHLASLQRACDRLEAVAGDCLEVPLGGTAVGTGLGTSAGYLDNVYPRLREVTGLPLRPHPNFFDAFSNADIYQTASTAFKGLAVSLGKMARDLRLLSSGARAGLGEISLPIVQAGSSFMPAKVNPVMPELIVQVGYQVCGNDLVVTLALEGAELDFNAWTAVMTKNVLESCRLLTRSIPLFTRKCVEGIEVDVNGCRRDAERSLALSSIVAAVRGYDVGARAAEHAAANGATIREAVVELGIMSEQDADRLLDPLIATDGVRSAELVKAIKAESSGRAHGVVNVPR